MSDKQETIADIVAEMRGARTEFPFVYPMGEPDTPEIIDFTTNKIIAPRKINIRRVTVRELADRIEAAHKREVGNGAKMREALVNISKYADCAAMRQHDAHTQHYIEQIRKWADAALAAPPRNCDVISEDAMKEGFWKASEEAMKCFSNTKKLKLIVKVAIEIITSLYATYKEDEAEQEKGGEK